MLKESSSLVILLLSLYMVVSSFHATHQKGHDVSRSIPRVTCAVSHSLLHLNPPLPNPPQPARAPRPLPSRGLLIIGPCSFTPLTTLSKPVSTTTPPTIISPNTACKVSKLKIRSNSQTLSKKLSRASTNTWIRSIKARGDSVEVLMRMK